MKPGEIITLEGDLILNQEMTSFELKNFQVQGYVQDSEKL